jgi:cation transport ATPase
VDIGVVVLAGLIPALGLLGDGVDLVRVALAVAAWALFAARTWIVDPDPSDPHPAVALLPTALAAGAAVWAKWTSDPQAMAIAVLVGMACAGFVIVERLVLRARDRVGASRERIERSLDVPVRVMQGGAPVSLPASEVRPGEHFVVEAGDVVGVDAVVSGGEARVVPWLGSGIEITRREGDPVVAGAKVLSSRLLMTTTWSGPDRAWLRLLSSPGSRIDVAAPTTWTLRRGVEWAAPVAGALAGLAAVGARASAVEIVASVAAGAIAVASKSAPAFASLLYARAHLQALASGITYRDARAFERAGATDIAVLSARGTVLLGEPEIIAIEPVGPVPPAPVGRSAPSQGASEAVVLGLAAGAEAGQAHPFATAILRAARARGVAADHVRNIRAFSGLGVTGIASSGDRLVVGGRAIMLAEKIGGATAEARVSVLEAQGRSVLLVALGDRLVGLIALQDGLRAGARPAVQKLLDAGIEPVLLSGEARDTCETLGRSLDIEHVRPEVLPADRRAEVLALGEGGSVVSVFGHPVGDDEILGAADVAVALGAAGGTPGEWAVALASDDVVRAADALLIPRKARAEARVASSLALVPAVIALLGIAFGAAPLALGPVAFVLGAAAAALYCRERAPS